MFLGIHFTGMSCCGPSFNLVLDDTKPEDNTEVINDITFLADKDVSRTIWSINNIIWRRKMA